MGQKMKGVLIVIALWTGLILFGNNARAQVTMDVDKWNGPSGTYRCVNTRSCWLLYRAAEARGDTYYCNSVVIKRDGKVIWFKNFYK